MDTEGVFGAAAFELSQEDYLAVHLAHADIVVLYALEVLFHLVKLVVVGGEEGACGGLGVLVQVFHDGPCDAYSVVSRRAPAKLVEEHERARRGVVENVGGLGHFHHERGFAQRDVVRRADTGENLVHQAYFRALCRHVAARLGHQSDERRLSQQSRFTGHVGTCYYDYLLSAVVKVDVVGHVALPYRQLGFYHWVASLLDVEHYFVGFYHRTDVSVFLRRFGEGQQAVDFSHQGGVGLDGRYVLLHGFNKLAEELSFERKDFVFRPEDFLLVFLQLLSDVTFGLRQCLLAYPVVRHLVLERVAHFKVIAENVVVTYLERGYAGGLSLALLYLQQILLAAGGYASQLVKLGVHSLAYHPALAYQLRRVGVHLAPYPVAQALAEADVLADAAQRVVARLKTGGLHGAESLQGGAQLHHFARRNAPHGHL